MDFKQITLKSIPELQSVLSAGNKYRVCDYTVGGIFMWADYFGYEYAVEDETLFIRTGGEDGIYALPVGKLPLKEAVKKLCPVGCRNFSAVPEAGLKELNEFYSTEAAELIDWEDYLYSAAELAELKGKRFHRKKNKVNKFEAAFPDRRFEIIDKKNLWDVRRFFEDFSERYEKTGRLYQNEIDMCKTVLDNYSRFPFVGGVLYAGGKTAAFTVGELIDDTLYVHIEKADREKDGAYESINRYFAKFALNELKAQYINREEDVGDPGLRQAKRSYNPVALLKKFDVKVIGTIENKPLPSAAGKPVKTRTE